MCALSSQKKITKWNSNNSTNVGQLFKNEKITDILVHLHTDRQAKETLSQSDRGQSDILTE
jgi:hypothetical protein